MWSDGYLLTNSRTMNTVCVQWFAYILGKGYLNHGFNQVITSYLAYKNYSGWGWISQKNKTNCFLGKKFLLTSCHLNVFIPFFFLFSFLERKDLLEANCFGCCHQREEGVDTRIVQLLAIQRTVLVGFLSNTWMKTTQYTDFKELACIWSNKFWSNKGRSYSSGLATNISLTSVLP